MIGDIAEKAYKRGVDYLKAYGNCAQCTFAAVLDSLGLKSDDGIRCASGLAGGIGLCVDGVCGGYSAGVMAISLKYGRERSNFSDRKAMVKSFNLAKSLHDKFIQEYGSVICRDVQKKILGRYFNLLDPQEYNEFVKAGGFEKCAGVVGNAARWTVNVMQGEE